MFIYRNGCKLHLGLFKFWSVVGEITTDKNDLRYNPLQNTKPLIIIQILAVPRGGRLCQNACLNPPTTILGQGLRQRHLIASARSDSQKGA